MKRKKRKQAGAREELRREAGQRITFRNDRNCAAGANESTGKASWRTGDAPFDMAGRWRRTTFEQLCRHAGGLYRFPQCSKSG